MKKIVLSSVLIMAVAFTSQGWGLPDTPSVGTSKSSSSSLTETDIDAVIKAAKNATRLLRESTINITGILRGSEAKAELEAELESADKIEDPKERDAKINTILSNSASAAIKAGETAEGKEKIGKLSTAQGKEAGKAIINFALAGLLDVVAVKLGTNVVDKAGEDPMGAGVKFASKLNEIKDIVSTLPDQAVEISNMSESLFAIAQTGGISVELPTESEVTAAASSSRD